MSSHYTHQIARAYGLTFSPACFRGALQQYMCVLLHMVPDTRNSAADNRSSISAVFQVGDL